MKLKSILMSVSALALCSHVFAGDVELGVWDSELSGSIIGKSGNGQGVIRKQDDSSFSFGINLGFLGNGTTLSYNKNSYDTVIDATATFTFDGQNYAANDKINMNMDWTTWDLTFRAADFWDKAAKDGKRASGLRAVYGIQAIAAEIDLASTTTASRSNFDETIPVPFIGMEGHFSLGSKANFEMGLKGLDLSVSANEVTYYDTHFGVRFFLGKEQDKSLYLGYKDRTLEVTANEGDTDEARLDIGFDGLVASFRVEF